MFTIIILETLIHDSDQSVSKLRRKLIKKSYKHVLKARMLAYVVLRGGGNRGKPPTLDDHFPATCLYQGR